MRVSGFWRWRRGCYKMGIVIYDRITVEPAKCGGKPCVRGMRITVRRVLEILASCRDRDEILREYAFLEEEDLNQVLRYAAASIDDELVELNRVA